MLNWSQSCRKRKVGTAVWFESCRMPTVLHHVRVTTFQVICGWSFGPGLEPKQTELLVTTRTAGGSPGPVANTNWEHWRQAWGCRPKAWEHLGGSGTSLAATWITVEQSRKNYIIFDNAAGVPGNHTNYISFSDSWNSRIQCVFSGMYLCIYLATHLQTVYLDWQRAIWGGPGNQDEVNTEIHPEAVIEWVWRWTWRRHSSVFRDTLGGCDRLNVEMHCGIVIERVCRYSWSPWSCELRGRNQARLEIHLEALREQVWRFTWRQWPS